jgi:hypothetical protein
MSEETFLVSESKRLYQTVKSTDKETFLTATEGDCDRIMSGMIHRMASNVSEAEFVEFMVNGTMPLIELSDEELAKIQGAKALVSKSRRKGADPVTFFNNEGDITFYSSSSG